MNTGLGVGDSCVLDLGLTLIYWVLTGRVLLPWDPRCNEKIK